MNYIKDFFGKSRENINNVKAGALFQLLMSLTSVEYETLIRKPQPIEPEEALKFCNNYTQLLFRRVANFAVVLYKLREINYTGELISSEMFESFSNWKINNTNINIDGEREILSHWVMYEGVDLIETYARLLLKVSNVEIQNKKTLKLTFDPSELKLSDKRIGASEP